MVENDEALIIGLVIVLVFFASAIATWDPRILFPEYQNETPIGVETKGSGHLEFAVNETYLNWGVLDPGGFAERGLLISNLGDSGALSFHSGNYTPVDAQQFLNLSWSLEPGFILKANNNIDVTLTLTVSPQISNITNFSFDVMITITELAKTET